MDEGGTPLLPDSLVYQIFLSLGPADLLAAGLACRQWQAVSRDEFLWREQFYRYYQVARDVPRHPAATSWYEEFRRLYDSVPCVEVQTLRAHTDQVLHLSFSHSGCQFASCSKDCTVKIWNNDLTISLLHSADMRPYNWSYSQFSQFNQEIDLLVFDLKTMRAVKRALRAHRAYTPNDECFFLFLDVSRDFVASGAEDRHGYVWDRHYNICLAKLRHQDVVNSVVFSPQEQELLLTASDDATIKAWRSPRTVRALQAPRPRPFFSWFGSQRR
uniref:F-box and WD repeat domain containing 5 n=1 Tax=Pipistrellus kuhlii TaxID=59472 RepID=A0A7J7RWE5_PIPKU|nr:F-box and WD repeat domain containing 5 [Pipistrellus kuhlii]